jgi:hypothetical protein
VVVEKNVWITDRFFDNLYKKQKRAIARFLMFQVDLLMYSEKSYLFIPIAIRKKLSSSHNTETEPLQANNFS